jgi:hypothetical protein
MSKRKPQPQQFNNQYTGLLWPNNGAWKGCFCTDPTPNAKANARIEGESVANLTVVHDNGEHLGEMKIVRIANPTSALAATGVFISVEGERIGLAVFYDELAGRYRIAKQRPRPELV